MKLQLKLAFTLGSSSDLAAGCPSAGIGLIRFFGVDGNRRRGNLRSLHALSVSPFTPTGHLSLAIAWVLVTFGLLLLGTLNRRGYWLPLAYATLHSFQQPCAGSAVSGSSFLTLCVLLHARYNNRDLNSFTTHALSAVHARHAHSLASCVVLSRLCPLCCARLPAIRLVRHQ